MLAYGWCGSDAAAECLRSALVQTTDDEDYFSIDYTKMVRVTRRDPIMVINAFAMGKIGNIAQAEMNFLRLSYEEGCAAVARKQIQWIGKSPKELVVLKSSYTEEKEALLKKMLLEINGYSNQMLQKAKKAIATEFRNNILKDMKLPASSFETKKLEQICRKYGLVFKQDEDCDKKAVYTIAEKQ